MGTASSNDRVGVREAGIMVFNLTEMRWIKEALQRQMEREQRLLLFLERGRNLTEDVAEQQASIRDQEAIVSGYRQLLGKVCRQLG
ncbi:MAG: hypothetical protein D9V47_02520 [Clostridia bacterium]|nr:MAG: hypothetical protein D9V47_02520 [Clostridia bacterium]